MKHSLCKKEVLSVIRRANDRYNHVPSTAAITTRKRAVSVAVVILAAAVKDQHVHMSPMITYWI